TITANNPQTICAGTYYNINSHNYYAAGSYIDTLFTAGSCDSIVTTQLSVIIYSPIAGSGPADTNSTHFNITHANVLLFNSDSSGAIAPLQPVPVDAFGNYVFNNVTDGNYKLQLVPDTNVYHAAAMKTYYANAFLWDSARVVNTY